MRYEEIVLIRGAPTRPGSFLLCSERAHQVDFSRFASIYRLSFDVMAYVDGDQAVNIKILSS